MESTCSVSGCDEKSISKFYGGDSYCQIHYNEAINNEFTDHFEKWEDETAPPRRLVYLFGRLYKERPLKNSRGYLSAARIRDRGFNFKKTSSGTSFSITRHYNAWSDGPMKRVVEIWDLNYVDDIAELIETREWKDGDPD